MSRINTRQVEVYFTQPMDKKRFIQDILDEYMQYAFIGEIQMGPDKSVHKDLEKYQDFYDMMENHHEFGNVDRFASSSRFKGQLEVLNEDPAELFIVLGGNAEQVYAFEIWLLIHVPAVRTMYRYSIEMIQS